MKHLIVDSEGIKLAEMPDEPKLGFGYHQHVMVTCEYESAQKQAIAEAKLFEDQERVKKYLPNDEWLKAGLKPLSMNEKLKALVWKLDREIWARVEKQDATTSWGREQSAKLIQQYADEQKQQFEDKLKEMLQALKGIEGICDNQNPSHEDIWRIANHCITKHGQHLTDQELLTRYHESQKI